MIAGLKKAAMLLVTLTVANYPVHLLAGVEEAGPDLKIKVEGVAAKYLKEVEVLNADGKSLDGETTVNYSSAAMTRFDMGPTGLNDKLLITLKPSSERWNFRLEQRDETSVSIMDEGPHMDLVDWKHHVSAWEVLPHKGGMTFVSRIAVSTEFPKVGRDELKRAAREQTKNWIKQGYQTDDRWIKIAKQCEGVNSYPCAVGVSKITVRIRVKEGDEWRTVHTIELKMAMGC